MTDTTARLPSLTGRRLLFGLGSAAGAEAISPGLAAKTLATSPSGSENRVKQVELDRILAQHKLWLDQNVAVWF